jgi:hypothetical protein
VAENYSRRSNRILLEFGCSTWFVIVFVSGFLVAGISQDPGWSNERDFWNVFPVACIHFILAGFYFKWVRHWSRWPVGALAVIALACFLGMIWEVWVR